MPSPPTLPSPVRSLSLKVAVTAATSWPKAARPTAHPDTVLPEIDGDSEGTNVQMPYPFVPQLDTELPLITSPVPPPSPLLSVWMPLSEAVMTLSRIVVPFEWLVEMASLVSDTVLLLMVPAPLNTKMPIDALSPWTFDT